MHNLFPFAIITLFESDENSCWCALLRFGDVSMKKSKQGKNDSSREKNKDSFFF